MLSEVVSYFLLLLLAAYALGLMYLIKLAYDWQRDPNLGGKGVTMPWWICGIAFLVAARAGAGNAGSAVATCVVVSFVRVARSLSNRREHATATPSPHSTPPRRRREAARTHTPIPAQTTTTSAPRNTSGGSPAIRNDCRI